MGNRILYSNVRAQTGPQLRGKIQFVVRHFEFVTVEFFVAHALWFFRLVALYMYRNIKIRVCTLRFVHIHQDPGIQ